MILTPTPKDAKPGLSRTLLSQVSPDVGADQLCFMDETAGRKKLLKT